MATSYPDAPNLSNIYMLVDPRDLQVRYVGVTVTPVEARARRHMLEAHHRNAAGGWKYFTVHALWLRELSSIGMKPQVILLETTVDRKRECYWIAHYRNAGCNLNNRSVGGEGAATIPEEAKIKICRANKGKVVSDITRSRLQQASTGHHSGMTGKKHTPEAVEKIRSLNPAGSCHHNYGRVHSAEAREKMSASRVGRRHSEETKRKIAASHLGIKPSEETKRKIGRANSKKK